MMANYYFTHNPYGDLNEYVRINTRDLKGEKQNQFMNTTFYVYDSRFLRVHPLDTQQVYNETYIKMLKSPLEQFEFLKKRVII